MVVREDKEVGLEMCEVGFINREKHYSGRVVFFLKMSLLQGMMFFEKAALSIERRLFLLSHRTDC